jgi:catecholate siderophore receptor
MSMGGELTNGWSLVADNIGCGSAVARSDQRTSSSWRAFKSALLLGAASFVADAAGAQQAPEPVPLPPLNVEATAKKKAAAKKGAAKKAAPAQQVAPAPQPPPVQAAQQADPLPGEAGPPAPGSFNANFSSSPKMTAPLLDTPQTVNVITNAVIEERNATTLTEALRTVPGISFNAGENGFTTNPNNFQLRGFDSSGNIFIDGVRDSGSYPRDMFNVDRIEVVKGAAADNGRGGAGGYINIITKTPTLEDFVHADTVLSFDEYGTDVHSRSTIDVNQRVGTVAVRMNGMYEDGGVMGRDFAELNAYGLAPSIAFGLGTDTRAVFSYERVERHDLPDWGVPAQTIDGMFRYDPVAARAGRDRFYGLASDFDDVQGDSVVARFEHDFSPFFTISNQTRWSETDRLARFVYPNGYTTATNIEATNLAFYDRANTSLSNQTNLSGRFVTGGFRHTFSTGVEFTREESDANRQAQVGGGTTNIFDPNPYRTNHASLAFNPTERNAVDIDTAAAYIYDTIDITRQWQLTGGLRVEHYNVEFESRAVPSGAPLGLDGYENSETTLGGKIGLVYKPVEEGSLYVSYGVSALPPGSFLSNPDISRTGEDGAFPGFIAGADPVEMHNYEVGVKWDFFGGRLSTTAAAFHTEKRNVAYGGFGLAANPGVGWPGNTIAYGEQVVEGIEVSIAGNLTERWKAFGGLLVMDSERRHGALVDAAARATNTGDYLVAGGANSSDPAWNAVHPAGVTTTNGDDLSFTPNFTATLWTTYDVTNELTLGGGVQYVGESWLGRPDDALRLIPNGKFGKLPDYFLVNAMASYELTETVDLQFNVDNVFDELAAVSANWPGQRALLAPPRTYRIGTSVDF